MLINILDKGFVKLVDHMGSDKDIVRQQRVSFGKEEYNDDEKDKKLLMYLLKHNHGTPFEHVVFKFHVKCPIFVVRQWFRHRMCLSGDTELYFDLPQGVKRSKPYIYKLTIKDVYDKFYKEHILEHKDNKRRQEILKKLQFKDIKERICKMNLRHMNEKTLEIDHTHIVDVYYSGKKHIYEVKLKNGKKIKCSLDHKFYTDKGWMRLKDIINPVIDEETHEVKSINPIQKVSNNGITVFELSNKEKRKIPTLKKLNKIDELSDEEKDERKLNIHYLTRLIENGNLEQFKGKYKKEFNEPVLKKEIIGLYEKVKLMVYFQEIESVKYVGYEDTYDLEVEGKNGHNFVANGFIVHNSSYNEISGRYTEYSDEFYIPERLRVQDIKNKQGSKFVDDFKDEDKLLKEMEDQMKMSFDKYGELIDKGVQRELQRIILPMSTYTQFYWTVNLRSLFNFLKLRLDKHAQWEIRQYQKQIQKIVKEKCPWSYEGFEKYILNPKIISD